MLSSRDPKKQKSDPPEVREVCETIEAALGDLTLPDNMCVVVKHTDGNITSDYQPKLNYESGQDGSQNNK